MRKESSGKHAAKRQDRIDSAKRRIDRAQRRLFDDKKWYKRRERKRQGRNRKSAREAAMQILQCRFEDLVPAVKSRAPTQLALVRTRDTDTLLADFDADRLHTLADEALEEPADNSSQSPTRTRRSRRPTKRTTP